MSKRPEPSGGVQARQAPAGGARVLVVDDEGSIRTICRINLEAAGMTVAEAADGAEALRAVQAERPSVVLLDVMMPRVDGWDVAERLAADPATREIPVVFLSARADADDRRRAHAAGAVGYIVKPFDPLELGAKLATLIERIRRGEREQLRDEIVQET